MAGNGADRLVYLAPLLQPSDISGVCSLFDLTQKIHRFCLVTRFARIVERHNRLARVLIG